ncbi:MAG: hypothetical protein KME43_03945 [Myxacorys chilensis ATA2-1-KO14]|jgi:hypothetical protein|nr:hypothetical protein [Myxacorys chilensis ATA2-1-KO14]
MPWYVYVAHFFAGVFLANGVPHFVNGISGHRFQTPFASPPAVGESSPIVNVVWGMTNFAIGAWLLLGIEALRVGFNPDTIAVFLGAFIIAITLAWHFGRVRNQ